MMISPKFVPESPINNTPVLIRIDDEDAASHYMH